MMMMMMMTSREKCTCGEHGYNGNDDNVSDDEECGLGDKNRMMTAESKTVCRIHRLQPQLPVMMPPMTYKLSDNKL